jgi:hypothetical protein
LSNYTKESLIDLLRTYRPGTPKDKVITLPTSVQLCVSVAVRNVNFTSDENSAKVQATLEIMYDDGSFVDNQTIDFRDFKEVVPASFATSEGMLGQPTSNWQRKCLIGLFYRSLYWDLIIYSGRNKANELYSIDISIR